MKRFEPTRRDSKVRYQPYLNAQCDCRLVHGLKPDKHADTACWHWLTLIT